MDVIAHGLWAGAAGVWAARRGARVSKSTLGWMVALALLPDLMQLMPVLAISLWQPQPWDFLRDYVTARPGMEPTMPTAAAVLAHHLHCVMHSVVVLGAITAFAWFRRRAWLLPLLGWWLHVFMDIPSHSAEFYPVSIFYPISEWAFDGVAWNTPWLFAANYLALTLVYGLLLFRTRRPAPAA